MTRQDADVQKCPYCSSADHCEHLLLLVDTTFRTAEGGALFLGFNHRWHAIMEREGAAADERACFDELLDEIASAADASWDYEVEGGPGMSSSYTIYYVATREKAAAIVEGFATSDECDDINGDHCPVCDRFHPPAADATCEHYAGWRWDGQLSRGGKLDHLASTWQSVCDSADEHAGGRDFALLLARIAREDLAMAGIVALVKRNADVLELIDKMDGVLYGEGWETGGMLSGSGSNIYLQNADSLAQTSAILERLHQAFEELPAEASTVAPPEAPEKKRDRVVFIIVPHWPGGTMAMKFGSALQTALKVTRDSMQLVQMDPERIFRVVTDVAEADFRRRLKASKVSYHGAIHFVVV